MSKYYKIEQVNPNDDEFQLLDVTFSNNSYVEAGDILLTVEGQKSAIEVEAVKPGYFFLLKTVGEYFNVRDDVYIIADTKEELKGSLDDIKDIDVNSLKIADKQPIKTIAKALMVCEPLKYRSSNGKVRLGVIFAGKSFRQVEDALEFSQSVEVVAFFDDVISVDDRYKGSVDVSNILFKKESESIDVFFISTGDKYLRAKYYNLLKAEGVSLINIIHPTSVISKTAVLGDNIYIGPNVVISSKAYVDSGCFISAMCNIEHHCQISSNTLLGPGVMLSGTVTIGKNSIVSAGVAIESNISVGESVFISSGQGICRIVKDNEKI